MEYKNKNIEKIVTEIDEKVKEKLATPTTH